MHIWDKGIHFWVKSLNFWLKLCNEKLILFIYNVTPLASASTLLHVMPLTNWKSYKHYKPYAYLWKDLCALIEIWFVYYLHYTICIFYISLKLISLPQNITCPSFFRVHFARILSTSVSVSDINQLCAHRRQCF